MTSFYLYAKSPDSKRVELICIPCGSPKNYGEIEDECVSTGKIKREDGEWKVLKTFTFQENSTLEALNRLSPRVLGEVLKEISLT